MTRFLLTLSLFILSVLSSAAQTDRQSFIDNLLSKMTLKEKLGQMNQLSVGDIQTGAAQNTRVGKQIIAGEVGSVFNVIGKEKIRKLQELAVEKSRLHIPLLVGLDVIHGYQTLFPIPLGMASTWDMKAIEQSARIAAVQATDNGIAWTFSPMVDICIDPRWGRQAEGAGEDPYLGSCVAKAMVKGYQTDDLRGSNSLLACVKHFALYGAAEGGRDYNTIDMSRLRMYNQYLPPYKAAIDAGALTVMSSFNVVDYVPATANKWLLTDLLRNEWGFKGMVVTDYASIGEMETHGMGKIKDNAARALLAGTDMDMVSNAFFKTLESSLNDGTVSMNDIDTAVRRILEVKYDLGLFENPYKYLTDTNESADEKVQKRAEQDAIARKITAESFVLLKNDNNLLPIKKQGTIALIGPMSETRTDISGTWSFAQTPEAYLTLREGLEKAVKGKATLLCSQGCNLVDNPQVQEAVGKGHGNIPIPWVDSEQALKEAMKVAKKSDVIVCAMGECAWMNGEGTSRTDLTMPAPQLNLLKSLLTLGKPIILLNFSGRSTVLTWESQNIPAIMNVWYGSQCAEAVADVLFGDEEPGGRLTVSMPKATGQVPLYYNRLPSGRYVPDEEPNYQVFNGNYLDVRNGALYPFGYGLSYTSFDISPIHLSSTTMTKDGYIDATVTVTNTGERTGSEVIQLYIHDIAASISRPVRELRGFERVTLQKGEKRDVTFRINKETLEFFDATLTKTTEPGDFDIFIGNSSETKNATKITLQ